VGAVASVYSVRADIALYCLIDVSRSELHRTLLSSQETLVYGWLFGPDGVRDEGRIISIERILIPLGREQANWMMTEEDTIAVRCEICGRRYLFSREELADLMEERL